MKEVSTLVFTHKVFVRAAKGVFEEYRVTEQEAALSLKAWSDKKPVPVPNNKDPNRSSMYIDPFAIFQIKRYKR